jgi:preprotein translocase subunit SecA
MNKQREVIYDQRKRILSEENPQRASWRRCLTRCIGDANETYIPRKVPWSMGTWRGSETG